jgi:endo-1,4-beta-mannosidase
VRPRLKQGSHLRDEEHQARELTKTLGILDAEGADGAFVWTFADPWLTHSTDPRHDLDMTATSLVKTYARGHGSTYPDLPWEPKQAFSAVAGFYAAR